MKKFRFIDIGINLTDPVFRGVYHGKQAHQDDFSHVMERANNHGVEKMIITVGQLKEVQPAIDICKKNSNLYATVGCHPTRCNEFEKWKDGPDGYYNELLSSIRQHSQYVVAIGEMGLDYDREHFCARKTQLQYFEKQLELAGETSLPLFLHMRNACDDFINIYSKYRDTIKGGVAHCFTGTTEEAKKLMDLGLYLGITGCSLKTADNLETLRNIPREFLMIETDAPWCEIRNTHASSKFITTKFETKKKEKWQSDCCVKSRNEPCHIVNVLEAMAGAREEDINELAETLYENTTKLFFPNK